MVQKFYGYDKHTASEFVSDYESKSKYQREQIRKPIVRHFLRMQKYEHAGIIPPEDEERLKIEAPPEKPKREKIEKFSETGIIHTSKGDFSEEYVEARREQGNRFLPVGGSSEHYYDLKTGEELSRRQYDTRVKAEGRFF